MCARCLCRLRMGRESHCCPAEVLGAAGRSHLGRIGSGCDAGGVAVGHLQPPGAARACSCRWMGVAARPGLGLSLVSSRGVFLSGPAIAHLPSPIQGGMASLRLGSPPLDDLAPRRGTATRMVRLQLEAPRRPALLPVWSRPDRSSLGAAAATPVIRGSGVALRRGAGRVPGGLFVEMISAGSVGSTTRALLPAGQCRRDISTRSRWICSTRRPPLTGCPPTCGRPGRGVGARRGALRSAD